MDEMIFGMPVILSREVPKDSIVLVNQGQKAVVVHPSSLSALQRVHTKMAARPNGWKMHNNDIHPDYLPCEQSDDYDPAVVYHVTADEFSDVLKGIGDITVATTQFGASIKATELTMESFADVLRKLDLIGATKIRTVHDSITADVPLRSVDRGASGGSESLSDGLLGSSVLLRRRQP